MEVLSIFFSLVLVFLLFLDLIYKKNNALKVVFFANPYISGLLLYFSIYRDFIFGNKPKFKVNIKNIILFLILLLSIVSMYFYMSVNLRTVIQVIQFILITITVWFVILPLKCSFQNLDTVINGLYLSTLLLCLIKVIFYFLGDSEYSRFGKNEDSYILVIIGMFSSLLRFKKLGLSYILSQLILLFSLYLYEARAALAMALLTLPLIVIFKFYKYRFNKSVIISVLFFITIMLLFLLFFDGLTFVNQLFDVSRNHSNIERFSMHLFTFKYLFSNQDIYGLGNLDLAMNDMKTAGLIAEYYPHPHSTYLRFSLELGWVGIIAILLFYSALIYKTKIIYNKSRKFGCIYLLLIINIIIFSFVDSIYFSFFRANCTLIAISLFIAAFNVEKLRTLKVKV